MILFDSIRNRPYGAATALFIATAIGYWVYIHPLEVTYTEAIGRAADFRKRCERVALELRQLQEKQRTIAVSLDALQALYKEAPKQPAIVWVPAHIQSTFSHLSMSPPDVQLECSASDWELPEYARIDWSIVVPQQQKRKLTDVLLAVAQIEQAGLFVKIQNLSLGAATAEPGDSIGYLKLITYLPK